MGNPALAVDDVRGPAEFLHRFQDAAGEENRPFAVVGEEFSVIVPVDEFALEIVFVVDEIDLYAGRGDGGHLDDEGVVRFSYDYVDARQADNLVKLVLAFVDAAIAGHEHADFAPFLLDSLGKFAADACDVRFWEVRKHFRVNEQNFFHRFSHNSYI